jgi:hypothetical protein
MACTSTIALLTFTNLYNVSNKKCNECNSRKQTLFDKESINNQFYITNSIGKSPSRKAKDNQENCAPYGIRTFITVFTSAFHLFSARDRYLIYAFPALLELF